MSVEYVDISDITFDGELNFPEEVMKPIRESISSQGLHHPLLVVEFFHDSNTFNGDGLKASDGKYKLIAGKKRLLALKQLQTKEAPVKIYPSNLTPDQIFEISLHENLKRYNLPWYEQVETELQLHELRQRINGVKSGGRPRLTAGGKTGWSQVDTARELGIAVGVLSEDLDLARAVAVNPSLKNVKDKTTAMKLIRVQARREGAEAFALIPSDFEMDQVFLGDSLEILKQFPASTFDTCITDPPWSTYQRDESLTAEQIDLLPIFREIFRVLKGDSFLYVITSSIDTYHYLSELPKIGFRVQSYPLIWHKESTITHGRRNHEFTRDYEPIILAVKGSPVLTSVTEISSILRYKNLHYTKLIHPNEKPIELIKALIGYSTFAGNSILDPFAGSGVTLDAARQTERHYIGIEKEKKFYDKIVARLK